MLTAQFNRMLNRRGKLVQEGKGKVFHSHNEKGESHKQRDKQRICTTAVPLSFIKPWEAKDARIQNSKVQSLCFIFSLSGTASVGFIYFRRRRCSDIITDKISARTHWHCYCIGGLYNTAATVPLGSEVWGSSNKEIETQIKIHKRTRLPM